MIAEGDFAWDPTDPAEIVARRVVDAAFQVHRALGPGLLESVYQACLCHELARQAVAHRAQVGLPIKYQGLTIDGGLRIDLLAGDLVVVEVKAVERILPVHRAQLLTYLKLADLRLGLLINFNVPAIREGIRRVVR
jgi:GxxExxY protein